METLRSGNDQQAVFEALQAMTRQLPPTIQGKLPYDTLSELSSCLMNDTIFEIVKGLHEIQHVIEKQLLQQRMNILHRHKSEKDTLVKTFQINSQLDPRRTNEFEKEKAKLAEKQKDEIKEFDLGLIKQLDQKVTDQQTTLEKAGVPGFFVTDDPNDIQTQTHLLTFITQLSRR
uniref:EOG090X0GJG n=1 Tax=Lynceus sp. MCZ IZ 141354 TaxID=1930659 RepID=A0A9N6ZFT8_9CRUS|nr:EOG090X0GJG [Lynceus sp. MCZ IZ 141354]